MNAHRHRGFGFVRAMVVLTRTSRSPANHSTAMTSQVVCVPAGTDLRELGRDLRQQLLPAHEWDVVVVSLPPDPLANLEFPPREF